MKYLFYIAKNYSIPIIIPLAKYLEQTGREYRFYLSDKVKENRPEEWTENLICNRISEAKKFNPDFVLCPGNFVDFRIPGVKVQLFHGLGVEKAVHYKIRHFFDIYLTSGPYVTERFEKIRSNNPYFEIIETGWPKIDYIINFDAKNIKQKVNIPEDKNIILYAPTFSTQHESATALSSVIPEIMKDDEFWLFKFHELMDPQVISDFESIDSHKGRVLHNVEITPYLHAADVMISDTSSVIYEFMVLDKPIITYKTQARTDKGIDISKLEELRPVLDRCLNNSGELSKNRLRHIAEINPNIDGKIAQRVVENLEKAVKQKLFPLNGKPFNLFRKAQIIYHSIFRKGYLR